MSERMRVKALARGSGRRAVDVERLARERAEQALHNLVRVMGDRSIPATYRLRAAMVILDCAYGKPLRADEMDNED